MADMVTVQELEDAKIDARTIGDFINGGDEQIVVTRLLKEYPTLANAIRQIYEKGGKFYPTLAAANADIANIRTDVYVITGDNGAYYKATADATSLTKSAFDPLTQAKAYTDLYATVKAKELAGTIDLDSVLIEGNYYTTTTTANSGLNFPIKEALVLQVYTTSWAAIAQKATGLASGKTFERFRSPTGLWPSTWTVIASESFVSSSVLTALSTKEIAAATDLNTVTTKGQYRQSSSENATASKNYPENLAGFLSVSDSNWDALIQEYTVFLNGNKYVRQKTSSVSWTLWDKIVTGKNVSDYMYPSHLEWQPLYDSSLVYFDGATKTVAIPNYIIAPCNRVSGSRVRLYDVNFTFTANSQVAFIDLKDLVSNSNIDNTNVATLIKIKTYSDASGFDLKSGQIPLIKYDGTFNIASACAGFLDVINKNTITTNREYVHFKKTADDLSIYFPTSSSKKVRLNLWHQVVGTADLSDGMSNSNIWRINGLWGCSESMALDHQILANAGEWTLAIQHSDNTQSEGVVKDFVGGWHGDELLNSVKFFVDGAEFNQDFLASSIKSAMEIQVVQSSTIYFQNTNIPLCKHLSIFTFDKDGLNMKHQIEWLTNTNIKKIFGVMLPILRNVTGGFVTNKSSRTSEFHTQIDDNSTAGAVMRFTQVKEGHSFKQWGNIGFSCETKILKLPNKFESQSAFVSSATQYNKLYVSAFNAANETTDYAVIAGDIWEFETQYLFNYIR